MNHCKNKQRHKWKDAYGMGVVCEVCGKRKIYKTTPKGRKHARGAFGKQGVKHETKV